jgi:glycosyltransferase involved in cell wall biosynthesis
MKCNIAIATNLFQKKVLEKMAVPSKKIRVIPNAVDTMQFHPSIDSNALRKELQLENSKVVLTARRLTISKGVKYLIMAAPKILKNIPETKLLIIGEGREEDNIKKLAKRLEVYDKILFLGKISHDILPKYLALADVVVLPSLYEPFGVSAIESLSMEKPVVAFNIMGLPEIIDQRKTGLLVPPRDYESLAKGIINLLTDRDLAIKFGKNGRDVVLRNFSYQQIITKIKRLYAEISLNDAD